MADDEACRRRARNESLPDGLVDPHPDRHDSAGVDHARVIAAHRRAIADGADGYVDPVSGMFAFTALYHWNKGTCCDLGCRHCPWVDADVRMQD